MNLTENPLRLSIELGDEVSLERIYRHYWSRLYVYAFNILREKEICEDIVQEIFVDLWMKRYDVYVSDLDAYLYQAVRNQICNHFRRSKYRKELLLEFQSIEAAGKIDELYEREELRKCLSEIVSKLPEQRRRVFSMSKYDGLSNKEISEHLSISLQTVKNQISQSLKYIRKSLKNYSLLLF